jgi:NADH-quinone oxidoreductase subunit M
MNAEAALPLLAASLAGAPLLAAMALRANLRKAGPRVPAGIGLAASLTVSLVILGWWITSSAPTFSRGPHLGGGALVHIDGISAIMLPFVALCLLLTVLTAPRRFLDGPSTMHFLLGAAATFTMFLTAHPLVIVLLWIVTAWPVWLATRATPGGRAAARVYAYAVVIGALGVAAGTAMMLCDPPWEHGSGWRGTAGGWLVAIAVLMREGIVPFHFWVPALFRGAPMSMALLATVPQVGSYTAVRLLVGHADGVAGELVTLAQLAPVTAVYGAALALVQRDVRSLIGMLAFGQSALVLAGLAGTLPMELSGGLAVWMASGLSLTGVGLVAWALESRAGVMRLDLPQGRFWDAPALAAFFLLFGLAGIGLPGTLSFVADDLIISGSLADHVHGGILVIMATVLSGIAVMRGWFGIFGGPTVPDAPRHAILPRERVGFAALLGIIFLLGLIPGPLVRALDQVSSQLLAVRDPLDPSTPGSAQHGSSP